MSNPDVEIRKLMRRVDHFAAWLNPGLSAIAIVLGTRVLAEASVRLPALYNTPLVSDEPLLAIDPTALLTIDVPSSE